MAFDIAGLKPGLTLAEARALPAPGADKRPKRHLACFDEPALADHVVGLMKSDVKREASVGVLTCTIVDPDPMNTSYWEPATVQFGAANLVLWLPFVTGADGTQRLAQINLYPLNKRDEAAMQKELVSKLGQPKTASRAFVAMFSGAEPEPVSTWQDGKFVIDLDKSAFTYFYDPLLSRDLSTRLKKLPGGSFLYGVPQ